jgi:hypothetical protein
MADHDLATAVDLLTVKQCPCLRMRPSRAVQREDLDTFRRNLLEKEPFQPLPVLFPIFNGSLGAGPLAPKDWGETQLRKGADTRAEKKRMHKLELSALGLGKAI